MAKVTKKSSKKSTATKTEQPKVEEPAPKQAVPVEPGQITLLVTHADLATWANLMTICTETFEKLALKAAEDNDDPTFQRLKARYQLSTIFANKLYDCLKMPEPISRDIH
jgi:hypothetical protein